MSVPVLTWLVEAGEVGDAGRDLAHDGLDLPHDLLVALLLDRPGKHYKTTQSSHDTTHDGNLGSVREWAKVRIRASVGAHPFSTTSASVTMLKFQRSSTSLVALLMITSTILCSFPASSHSAISTDGKPTGKPHHIREPSKDGRPQMGGKTYLRAGR